ncbi:hypothetical protein JHK87_030095 [Glycine soja]|nr:hypothetical protein JHK87_030095 [Glycine soja]
MRVRNVVGSLCKILYALRVLSRRKRCACQESCRITVQTLYVLGILLRHYANIVHASASSCSASTLTSGGCGKATKIGVVVGVKRQLREAAGNSSVPFYPYKEIEKATNSFSEKHRLGTGGHLVQFMLENCTMMSGLL